MIGLEFAKSRRSFSSWCMVQPGDCSPSRRVVSKKTIWFWFGLGISHTVAAGKTAVAAVKSVRERVSSALHLVI